MDERNLPVFDKPTIRRIVKLIVETGIKNQWDSETIARLAANEVIRLAINTNLINGIEK